MAFIGGSNTGCCGQKSIQGFDGTVAKEMQDIGNVLENIAGVNNTGGRAVDIILNQYQQDMYGHLMEKFGFTLVVVWDNTSGSRCYYYIRITGDKLVVPSNKWPKSYQKPLMRETLPMQVVRKKKIVTNPFKSNGGAWTLADGE